MVADGIYYALALGTAAAGLSGWLHPVSGIPLAALALFCLYFFRDPERQIPEGPVAVSPADGKVVEIRPADGGGQRVSIFLNVFDVHVNRAPIGGRITDIRYSPGKFLIASREAASAENEQNTVILEALRRVYRADALLRELLPL